MEALPRIEVLQKLCKVTNKWGLYIGLPESGEISLAAPYLDNDDYATEQIRCDEEGWLLFDTEEEMEKYYYMTVGDDGPTKLNSYSGNTRIYALTCGPDGQLLNENT